MFHLLLFIQFEQPLVYRAVYRGIPWYTGRYTLVYSSFTLVYSWRMAQYTPWYTGRYTLVHCWLTLEYPRYTARYTARHAPATQPGFLLVNPCYNPNKPVVYLGIPPGTPLVYPRYTARYAPGTQNDFPKFREVILVYP